MGVARDFAAPLGQPGRHRDGVFRGQHHAVSRRESQLVLELPHAEAFGRFVPDRHFPAQMDQPARVDAGAGRCPVDEGRENGERVAIAFDADQDAGRFLRRGAGQALGPHLEGDALGKRRQHLRGEFRCLLEAIETTAWEIFQLAPR